MITIVPIVIAGQRLPVGNREMLPVRSPATGEQVARMVLAEPPDVDRAVAAARDAHPALAGMSYRERGALVGRVGEVLAGRAGEVARDLAGEQGKPLEAEARGEVAVAVEMWREASELIRHWTEEILPSDDPDRRILVTRRPHGVLGVVTPWNFPATIPTEYLCAGVAAGNAIVWKPSELTPVTALHLLECIEEAGAPPGAVNIVPGYGRDVGAALTGHDGIDAVGFTGSPDTGRQVARAAAGKPCLLELGGNNATVVLDDVEVEDAVRRLAAASFTNAGQICSSTERVLVHRRVADAITEGLVESARAVRLGPSLDPETTMGPLNNEPTAAKVDRHLADATRHGAQILVGGRRADGFPTDLYYEPTVLSGLAPEMSAFGEETFGPVSGLTVFDSDEEAVALANRHDLGLIAGVLGADPARAMAVAEQLAVGIVNVGDVATAWQPHTPFGGFSGRRSGVGRLGGRYTIEALSQLQTFVVPRGRLVP